MAKSKTSKLTFVEVKRAVLCSLFNETEDKVETQFVCNNNQEMLKTIKQYEDKYINYKFSYRSFDVGLNHKNKVIKQYN